MGMNSQYRRQQWKEFRETCISLANGCCELCGKTQESCCLQVHHPHYEHGREPWEYDPQFCQVLCKGCHAGEHKLIKPTSGWMLLRSDWDDGEPTGDTTCDNCGASMSWHNEMWHPDWGVITVGYECAELLGSYEATSKRRHFMRKRTFIRSPRWKTTSKGFLYKHGEVKVFVMQRGLDDYVLNINDQWGKRRYASKDSAAAAAFDYIG